MAKKTPNPKEQLRPNNAARPKQRNPHFCETRAVQCKSVGHEGFGSGCEFEGGRNRISDRILVVELKTQPIFEKYVNQSQIGSFAGEHKKQILVGGFSPIEKY